MSYFAKVEDGIVTAVISSVQDLINDGIYGPKEQWIQTSYNTLGGKHYDPKTREEDSGTPLRKNFAGIGYTYDSVRDAFIAPQPYPSWTLNDTTCLWEPPVAYPDPNAEEDRVYDWVEAETNWIKRT